jgi:cathepsin B
MRAVLVCSLLCAIAFVAAAIHPDTLKIINEVNSKKTTWVAAPNKFSDWTKEQLKCLTGTAVIPQTRYSTDKMLKIKQYEMMNRNSGIPESFDSRAQWPKCIHPIRDQARCGSCWAFGASEALSDRFCIASNGTINVVLSPQDMVSCDTSNMGCNGGYLDSAWAYLVSDGVVPEWCFPYASQSGDAPECPTTCVNNATITFDSVKYKASKYYSVGSWIFFWQRVETIQKEIMTYGPIEVGFSVYEDFMTYKSGVYQYTSGSLLGGHAVKMIGWGVDSATKTPYWLISNSWSTSWGEEGNFRILRGNDECGIEAQAYAGLADVQHAPK